MSSKNLKMITKILPSNVSGDRYTVSCLDQILIDGTGSLLVGQKDLWLDMKILPLCGLNHCYSSDFSGNYFSPISDNIKTSL